MVLRLLGKLLSALLFKAGLWAPLLFAAVYGCLVWFAGIPYSATGLGVGAVIAWVLGVAAAVAVYRRRRVDEPRTTIRKVRRRETDVRVRPSAEPASETDSRPAGRSAPYPSGTAVSERAESYGAPGRSQAGRDEESLAEKYGLTPYTETSDAAAVPADDGVSAETARYAARTDKPVAEEIFEQERKRLWARLEHSGRPGQSAGAPSAAPDEEEERPYAYASRSDPNLYIYEYADRLEYYRRMGDEMIHTSTEYKTEDTSRAAR